MSKLKLTKSFFENFYKDLEKSEGAVNRVYSDSVGIPTLGVGYALVQGTAKNKTLRGYDKNKTKEENRKAFNENLKSFTDKNESFTKKGYETLLKAVDYSNKGKVSKAYALIPPVVGKETEAKNKFGFSLTTKSMQRLSQNAMQDAVNGAWASIKKTAKNLPDGNKKLETLAKHFNENPEKLIGVSSLSYNQGFLNKGGKPKTPSMNKAMLNQDWTEAFYELTYNNNVGVARSSGIAKRRLQEGSKLIGGIQNLSEEDKNSLMKKHGNKIKAEEKNFSNIYSGLNLSERMTKSSTITGDAYRVQKNDTLGKIAEKTGASLDEIMVLNPEIKDANKINLGQEIKLPKKEKTEEKEEKNNIEQNTNKDNENDEKVIQKEEEKDEVITDKEENTEKKEEEKEEKKEQSKVVKEVIDEAKKVDDPIDEIMRKPTENWTEKEADEVGKKSMKEPNVDEKKKLDQARKEFYKNHYPHETKKDEFGKMEKIEKAETIPEDEKPAETKDGKNLEKSVEKVAEKVGEIADKKDKKTAVVELQKGLNVLKPSNEKPIAEDGKLGPETRSTLKNTLVEKGEEEVVNSLKDEQEKEEEQQKKQEEAEQKKQEEEHLAEEKERDKHQKEQEKLKAEEEKKQEKISNLRERISKKEDKKSELEAVMREIEQESSQAKSEGESLVSEAENQKNSIGLQQDQIEDEEVRILEIRGKIESIREEKRAIAKQLEGLHLEEEKVKSSMENISTNLSKEEHENLQSSIDDQLENIENKRQEFLGQRDSLDQKIENSQTEISVIEGNISRIKEGISEDKKEQTAVVNEVKKHLSKANSESKIMTKENQIATLNSEVSDLQNQIQNL